ncbi:MAG: branched-chain amino acid ABC transporter substrate-binding protein [Candidatus Velthaea sp.]|jgi:branched-chain amino acid transport system substrate-binding protein
MSAALGLALSSTLSLSVPAFAATTLKIGIDLPTSGADATNGIPTRNGAVLAIEEANAKGLPGGNKLEADSLDDTVQGVHDPAQGAQNIKTFIADPTVMGVIGPFNSNVAKAEIPLTNDAGLAQISPSNTNTGLTKGDDAKTLRSSHPDTIAYFRVCTTDDKQGAAGAQFARKLGFKKVFVIDDNETYGKGLADVFETDFAKLGGTVLGHEHITKNQQDFKALLTKVHSLGPDAIFFGGTTSSGGGLVRKQMADVGLGSVAFIGGDGISDEEFIKETGSAADNSYYTVAAPETSKLATAKTFIAAYKKRFGEDPGPYSANAYAGAQIIIAAIIKAGANPTRADVLKNVAATTSIDTPIGTIGFDKNGDTTAPILSFYAIKGGKPQFVNQINLKD